MAEGKAIPEPGEIVIPEVISKLTGVQIGEEITMTDRKLRIVGFTRGTFSMASSVVFVSHRDLGELLKGRDQFSYIMVYANHGVSTQTLVDRIKDEVDIVNVLSNKDFIESDWQLAVQMGTEILRMMTTIGTLLATLIVAFTAYSLVARKKQELAIAKALGFSNMQIYIAALCQSVLITGIGLLLTLLLSYTLLIWLPAIAPQLNLSIRLHQFISITVIALPVAVVASLIAVRAVVKVDPMSVFSG